MQYKEGSKSVGSLCNTEKGLKCGLSMQYREGSKSVGSLCSNAPITGAVQGHWNGYSVVLPL